MKQTPDNSFLATLQRHEGGVVLNEMSGHLADVVRGVMATGAKGSVTLTLTVSPAQRGKGALVLTHDVKPKVPNQKASGSFWFADDNGNLTKKDPRQEEFPGFHPEPVVVTGDSETFSKMEEKLTDERKASNG